MEKQINATFKIFTGIATLLIVVGHVNPTGFAGPFDLVSPYSVHVAAFLFSSGYFWSVASEEEPSSWLARKARKILVPSLLTFLIYGALWSTLCLVGAANADAPSLIDLLAGFCFDASIVPLASPIWFVVPFFLAQCLHLCIRLLSKAIARGSEAPNLDNRLSTTISVLMGAVCVFVGGGRPSKQECYDCCVRRAGSLPGLQSAASIA